MIPNQTKTIDINTMLQRLSFLAKVPPINQINTDEDYDLSDDDLDDDDDADDEQIEDTSFKTSIRNNVICEEDENVDDESSNTLIIKQDHNLIEKNDYYNDGDIQNYFANSNENPVFAPISIKTDFTYSVDNEKSPRSQLFDLALELEKEKEDKIKLREELEKLKKSKEQDDELIKKMTQENRDLKDELNFSQRLAKELKETSQLNHDRFNQIDSLRTENQNLNEKLKALTNSNSQLTQQLEKMQKYENFVKSYTYVEVNTKLYQVVNKIGQGGFSEVFHCISFKEHKHYAMKRVNLAELDSENINLVMNEIELLKKLQNTEKVVQLYDYELLKNKNQLNMIMEIGSTDLNVVFKKEIQKYQCVREPGRAYYWLKMLEAVHAVHEKGIIHSDIKPGNFLVVGCEVKLIDFNISNSMQTDRTSITLMNDCGTLNYMAPETLLRDNDSKTRINKKTDVWSMGIILYFITYGKLPFQHLKNQYKMIHAICDPLQKELSFGPLGDADLLNTIKKCLAHEVGQRISVKELLEHPYLKRNLQSLK